MKRIVEFVGDEEVNPDRLAALTNGACVRYRYTCTESDQHLFDHTALGRRFAAAHTLKIVPQVTRAERVRAAEVAAARTVEEKLHAWGAATGTEITPAHLEKLSQLEAEAQQ